MKITKETWKRLLLFLFFTEAGCIKEVPEKKITKRKVIYAGTSSVVIPVACLIVAVTMQDNHTFTRQSQN